MKGSWEKIYTSQGRVQIEVLDTANEAKKFFVQQGLKNVMDLGCGTGRHTLMLADAGLNVHACDLSSTGVEITKKLIDDAGLSNVEYSIQDMYDLKIEDGVLDGILCIWVQGHGLVSDIQKGILEAYRVLKPGGIFYTDFVIREDPTYGLGDEIAPHTFVGGRPGEEGIPHYYTTIEELKTFFSAYDKVDITEKVYRFNDIHGGEHVINAVVVIARK